MPENEHPVYGFTKEESAEYQIKYMHNAFRQEFKSYCVKKGYAMNDAIIALMVLAVDSNLDLDAGRPPWAQS